LLTVTHMAHPQTCMTHTYPKCCSACITSVSFNVILFCMIICHGNEKLSEASFGWEELHCAVVWCGNMQLHLFW